jgi:hypothetical protein
MDEAESIEGAVRHVEAVVLESSEGEGETLARELEGSAGVDAGNDPVMGKPRSFTKLKTLVKSASL